MPLTGFWGAVVAVAIVIGAIIAVGGAAALLLASFNKSRMDALRQDNSDLDRRVERCEHELTNEKTLREAAEKNLALVAQENTRLWEQLTQRADVATVLIELREHHNKAELWWQAVGDHNQALEELTTALVGSMNRLAEGLGKHE